MKCMIPYCSSASAKKSAENRSFHRFPRNYLVQAWIDATGRKNWIPLQHHKICSRHFPNESLVFIGGKRILLPNAVPTLFLGPIQESGNETQDNARSINDSTEEKVFKRSKSMERQRDDGWLVVISEDRLKSNFGDNDRVISHGDKIKLTDAVSTTFKSTRQQHQYNETNFSDINRVTLGDNNRNLTLSDVRPPLPLVPCQECIYKTKQYEKKLLTQNKEIKNLSREIDKLKGKLEKAKTDLKSVRTKAKTRLKMISRLRKRYLDLAIDTDDSNDMKFEFCLVNETIFE